MRYYVDTSIWLNLFKREGDSTKGIPYWQIAKSFIDYVMFSEKDQIIYSGIVLRELQIKLSVNDYNNKRAFLESEYKFIKVEVVNEDKIQARKLESFYNFSISFYDLVHICVCRRLNLILITRDFQLIQIAKQNGVDAKRPEES